MEIHKGMYVLPQASIIIHTELKEHVATVRYRPCRYTPVLWEHESRDTKSCLIVDDLVIKYTSDDELQHLLSALRNNYKNLVDMEGPLICGITLLRDYIKQTVRLSMPDYIRLAL